MKPNLKGVFVACCVSLALSAAATTPTITTQPQSITVNNASTANFSVVATNAASYQWLFGTNTLQGQTNANLQLDDVVSNQAGSYTVVVTSPTGDSTNSQPAQLSIVPGTIVQFTLSKYADGTSSNIVVQLFDHDKPATVENFIHYITSGAYSNMFFDRLVAGFVLQGGTYYAADRGTNQLNGGPISRGTNQFPAQVDNEFNVGPYIPNHFGTISMALVSEKPDSATSAFFLNLADNSANLDNQNGGFTVFGRILSGTNVLDYFNTLSAPSNGIIDLNNNISTLPVNYQGTAMPADSNVFFCDFNFVTTPPVDTTPPTVVITSPTSNSAYTNGGPANVTGTASDNVGLAEVFCVSTSLEGSTAGLSQTNAAVGTTNWSLSLGSIEPGIYEITAFSQDGAGNLSTPARVYFTNLVQLTVITNIGGQLTSNSVYLVPGQALSLTASPVANAVFENWNVNGALSLNPVQTFTAQTNITATINYIALTLPSGLAFTTPEAGSTVNTTNASLFITGILPSSVTVTQLTCQLFLQSAAVTAPVQATVLGTRWSLEVSNLVNATYTVVVIAVDSSGEEGLVSETFTAVVHPPPAILSQTASFSVNVGSTANLSVSASNAISYQWYFGGNAIPGATNTSLTLENVTTNEAGQYTAVMASALGDSISTQPTVVTVIPGTIVQFAISGYAAGGVSNVVVQLFDNDKPATVQNFIHYIASGAYSNLFWTRCVPGFVLQGGDYSTKDRTNGPPPNLTSVESTFTQNVALTPPFPTFLDNEFGVGPLLHNTYGTIAMAKTAGDPNSANNTFFFNLADNTTNLDIENGGFTVFGRILSGSNVLDYFNTMSQPTIYDQIPASGAPNKGLFNAGVSSFDAVPVNYFGVNTPGDSNFFYIDFTFLGHPILDDTPPTVAWIYPAADGSTIISNLDVVLRGTASDDVGLARVQCAVYSATGPVAGGNSTGTTNWSFDCGNLAPGTYTGDIVAQDGAGNLCNHVYTTFTVLRSPFNVYTNGLGTLSTNLSEGNTTVGTQYVVKAIPAKGALFLNWSNNGVVSINPTLSFTMQNGSQIGATFVPNTLPGGITFSYPTANAKVAAKSVALSGKVAKTAGMTTVTAQFFSQATSNAVTGTMVANGSSTWALPSVQLAPGQYIVQALASNAAGNTTVITENFTVLAQLTVDITGPGTTSITNGTYLQSGTTYTIKAVPKAGQLFYAWNQASTPSVNPTATFVMTNGYTVSATFITNSLAKDITFTSPTANSTVLTNNFMLAGTISPSVKNPQVMCQLFTGSTAASGIMYATVTGNSWSIPLTGIAQGSYTVVAIASDSTGKQTLITENFKENLFINAAGTYYGVFYSTNNIATNSAGYFQVIMTSLGSVTIKLEFPQFTFAAQRALDSEGRTLLEGTGFEGQPIEFELNFDLLHGSESVSGFVYSVGVESFFTGYRGATKLPANTVAGKYLLDLETVTNLSSAGPTNDGFASLTVGKTGALSLAGTLADNTTFSEGVGVSKDGVWPVFATLYKGSGMLIGWETNVIGANGAAGSVGTVYWISPTNKAAYFTNGFSLLADFSGTNYVAPVVGKQYQVVFSGGSINPPLNNTLTVVHAGQLTAAAGAPDKLTISISSAGAITGKILNPATGKTLLINGAFNNPTVGGFGFVVDTDGQGIPFQITPVQ